MNALLALMKGPTPGSGPGSRPSLLVADPAGSLARLREFVRERGLAASPHRWAEVECALREGSTFLDFSARVSDGRARVLIEFGTEEPQMRCTVAVFDAQWDVAAADFGRIEAVLVCGAPASICEFEREVRAALTMPLAHLEFVVASNRLHA